MSAFVNIVIILCTSLLLSGLAEITMVQGIIMHRSHKSHHRAERRHRAVVDDGPLRFEPEPYNKKLGLNSTGKIHCKVAGGTSPVVQWFLNNEDSLPEGVTSVNGTMLIADASRRHAGRYTCRATDGDRSINATIVLDIVVLPRVLEPKSGAEMHVTRGQDVWLHCLAMGDPTPMIHWDRNLTILTPALEGVVNEDGEKSATTKIVLMRNGTLWLRNASDQDSDRYACTAGNAAGLSRNELTLIVHPETSESGGVAGKAVVVSVAVAAAYMLLVLALMLYCRRKRLQRRTRGEKIEIEMGEGREKLVEEGEEDKPKVANGVPVQNGRLVTQEKDSGADNSEVSAASRASKRSGHFDHLAVPRSLLTEQITLGRGEFGDVMLARIDLSQVKRFRSKECVGEAGARVRPVLVKALATNDEYQLSEFRRSLEMFSRVRHERVCRLLGLCNECEPHYMLIEHTEWGDLKHFLSSTRSPSERAEYLQRVGPAGVADVRSTAPAAPLAPHHAALLALHLAQAGAALAQHRLTHRDIAARNCVITSKLQLKLSCPALSRGPNSHEYFKLHDQVIPLRWLPAEAALEGDYSTKSDIYMFAATVWEIYTKAELPFAKLNDNSVLDRIRNGTLEWIVPDNVPEKMAALLNKCWSKSPSQRPLFDTICEDMTIIIKEVTAVSHDQLNGDQNKTEPT